ncbi:MAG: hypothetical protein AB2A00_14980 [Myxococcota bacterium]
MRSDVFLQNDSGAWSLVPRSAASRVIEDGRQNDEALARARDALLLGLVGDDSFVVRVVVDEPLTEPEQREWITHVQGALNLPYGKLVVLSGFDPDVLQGWLDGESEGTAHGVEVPAGEYLVDVYTYLHTMNGRVLRDTAWQEKLGAWFRRDHPNAPMPSWVAYEMTRDASEDPDHEALWRDLKGSVSKGALKISLEPLDWVGAVVHLTRRAPGVPLPEVPDGGWFGHEDGLRRPERCPLGIPANAKNDEVRSALSELLPARPKAPRAV